jgi:very-short-patch-repair endonuclease
MACREKMGSIMSMPKCIVAGQKVDEKKIARARQLRRRMTREEDALWQMLRRRQINGLIFRRQQIIDHFIVNFYCARANLVVEADGPIHEWQRGRDVEREKFLSARGLQILRIRNDEIASDLTAVIARIRMVSARGDI